MPSRQGHQAARRQEDVHLAPNERLTGARGTLRTAHPPRVRWTPLLGPLLTAAAVCFHVEHRVHQQLHRRGSVAHVHREALLHCIGDQLVHAVPSDVWQLPGQQHLCHAGALRIEGQARPQHEKQGEAARPEVDALVPEVAEAQLRGAVEVRSPVRQHEAAAAAGADPLCAVEVGNAQLRGRVQEEDVCRLKISVNNALAVQVVHAVEELAEEGLGLSLAEDAVRLLVGLERAVPADLHDHPQLWRILVQRDDPNDRWVPELTHEAVFLPREPLHLLVVAATALDGHLLAVGAAAR
mmetsp:Transcript_28675/g.77741  ORF Transcript_28675/g.77741 Transcript_28675/m.77741 type:complete len:296 (-) Transcript_28675:88-975(-)